MIPGAARAYAEGAGWHVFPLRGKTPCRSREGVEATLRGHGVDPAGLVGRWGSTSDANLLEALWPADATGLGVDLEASGLVVVDFDPPADAADPDAWTAAQRDELGLAGVGLEARTGRPGGLHLYFLAPPDAAFPKTTHGFRPGVDLKAAGAMTVLPPSRHPSGRSYEWAADSSPDDLVPLPLLGRARVATAADIRRLLGPGRRVRSDHRRALRAVLDGRAPCGPKGSDDYPEEGAHDFLRGLLWWLASKLPPDVDPESVGELFAASVDALQREVLSSGGTPRETPELVAGLFASAQAKICEDAEERGLDVDPRTGRLRQPPTREWFGGWRERRRVEYHPPSRGATLDGASAPTEQILRELRLDAGDAGRKDASQALTDAYESWLFRERAEHRAKALASIAFEPGAGDPVAELAAVAAGLPPGERDETATDAWRHWIWCTKRRALGLPVEHHLWLHLWGPQGSGKSTLIRRLLAPLADLILESKAVSMLGDPRCALALSENAVLFFDEMARARGVEPEIIKAVLSGEHVDSRAMYTRIVERIPIRCGFVSAANAPMAELVADATGNRRFFEVETPRRLDHARVNSLDAFAVWRSVDEHGPAPLLAAASLAALAARQAEARYLDPLEAWAEQALTPAREHDGSEAWASTDDLYAAASRWWERAGYRGSSEQWRVPTLVAFGRRLGTLLGQRSEQRVDASGRRRRGYCVRWLPGSEPGSGAVSHPRLSPRRAPRGQA